MGGLTVTVLAVDCQQVGGNGKGGYSWFASVS